MPGRNRIHKLTGGLSLMSRQSCIISYSAPVWERSIATSLPVCLFAVSLQCCLPKITTVRLNLLKLGIKWCLSLFRTPCSSVLRIFSIIGSQYVFRWHCNSKLRQHSQKWDRKCSQNRVLFEHCKIYGTDRSIKRLSMLHYFVDVVIYVGFHTPTQCLCNCSAGGSSRQNTII